MHIRKVKETNQDMVGVRPAKVIPDGSGDEGLAL